MRLRSSPTWERGGASKRLWPTQRTLLSCLPSFFLSLLSIFGLQSERKCFALLYTFLEKGKILPSSKFDNLGANTLGGEDKVSLERQVNRMWIHSKLELLWAVVRKAPSAVLWLASELIGNFCHLSESREAEDHRRPHSSGGNRQYTKEVN